jgi:hypothetical protein
MGYVQSKHVRAFFSRSVIYTGNSSGGRANSSAEVGHYLTVWSRRCISYGRTVYTVRRLIGLAKREAVRGTEHRVEQMLPRYLGT